MSSHRRKPSCGRLLPLVVLAALLLCAVGAAPGAAAPKTLHGSAYELMKGFMGHWDKDGFAKVTDFFDIYAGWSPAQDLLELFFGVNHWPTFNVADMGLTCGASLLIIDSLRRHTPAMDESSAPAPD